MADFGAVTSVVSRPVGTTLAAAASAGAGTITVDDVSRLTWPAGGLRIANEQFTYTVDAAADQSVDTVDLDEDEPGADEEGTLTLSGVLAAGYAVDEPVVQFEDGVVTERVATVILPGYAEELVLRVPRGLWDRLPAAIRDRDGAAETVALEDAGGQWVIADVVDQDPTVDASFVDASTLPTSTAAVLAGTGADSSAFFVEAWSNPSRVTAADASYATAVGTSSSATVTTHNTGYALPGTAANDSGAGSLAWTSVNNIKTKGGSPTFATSASVGTPDWGGGVTGTTQRLQATNFGLSVPVGATVTGITVEVTRASNTFTVDSTVKLIKAGSIVGTDAFSPGHWPADFGSATYGGDLWGTSWTPAQVNASNFGVSIQATNTSAGIAMVDAIRLRVAYTTTSVTDFRSNTHYLVATNFGLAVPDGAIVTGITATVKRKASANSGDNYAVDNQVRLSNGTDLSSVRTAAALAADGPGWATAAGIASYGGDSWGLEWTPDLVNAAAFGVVFSANVNNGVTASVDSISAAVAYVLAGDA